jgi:PAS domain S-box-containing protein
MVDDNAWHLFDDIPDGVIVANTTGTIVFANGQAMRLLGYARDELFGLSIDSLVPERFRARHSQHFRTFFAAPRARPLDGSLELHAVRRDGQEIPVDISLSPLRTEEDTLVLASLRDISERHRLLGEIRESADFNLAILASLEDHIAVLDRDGKVVAVNDAWVRFANSNGAEATDNFGPGVNYLDVCRRALEDGDEKVRLVLDGIRAVLDGSSTSYALNYACDSPTESRWFRMNVMPLVRQESGAIVSHTNITRLKLAELAKENALDEVERLQDQLRAENTCLREEIKNNHDFEEIVGQSDVLRLTLGKIEQVAQTDSNVLITGETGTGKELVARAIHERSSRKDRPLVKVNCAALPDSLLESELFGHKKGAFTGAISDRMGRFEVADGGSIFLDEISELAPVLQSKLLQVIEEGRFEPLGSDTTKKVDVRVIAATNRDLQAAIAEQKFRPDLFYRLAVFPIEVPPLRLRREDIPLLAWHFVTKHHAHLGKTITEIPDKEMEALTSYDWPGNVRELENLIERAMILSPGKSLVVAEWLSEPCKRADTRQGAGEQLESVERELIIEALEQCDWKIKGEGNAADRLDMPPSTVRSRMEKLGIKRPEQ